MLVLLYPMATMHASVQGGETMKKMTSVTLILALMHWDMIANGRRNYENAQKI